MNGLEYITGEDISPKTKPSSALILSSNSVPNISPVIPQVDSGTSITTLSNNIASTTTPASDTNSGTTSVTTVAVGAPKEDAVPTAAVVTTSTTSNVSNGSATVTATVVPTVTPTVTTTSQSLNNQVATPNSSNSIPASTETTVNVTAPAHAHAPAPAIEEEDTIVKNTRLLREASELFNNWKEEINKTFIPAYEKEPVPQGNNPQQWLQYITIGLRHFRGISAYFRDPENFELKERCVMNLGITNEFGNIEQYRKLLELLDDTFIIHLFNVGPQFIESLEKQLPGGTNARMKDVLEFLDKRKPLVIVEVVIEKKLINFWMNLESRLNSVFELFKFFAQEETHWNRFKTDDESKEDEIIDEFLNKILPFQFKVLFRSLKGINNIPVQKQFCKILADEYEKWKKNKKDYVVIKYKTIASRISVPSNPQATTKPLQFFSQPTKLPGSTTFIRPQDPHQSTPNNPVLTSTPTPVPRSTVTTPPITQLAVSTPSVQTYTTAPERALDPIPAKPVQTTVPTGPRNSVSNTPSSETPVRSFTPPYKKPRLEYDSYRPSSKSNGSYYASKDAPSESRGSDYNSKNQKSDSRTDNNRSNVTTDRYRPDNRSDTRSSKKPESRPDARSDRRSDARPNKRPEMGTERLENRPVDRFETRSERSVSNVSDTRPNNRCITSESRMEESRNDYYRSKHTLIGPKSQSTSTDHRSNTNNSRKRSFEEVEPRFAPSPAPDTVPAPTPRPQPKVHPDRLKQVAQAKTPPNARAALQASRLVPHSKSIPPTPKAIPQEHTKHADFQSAADFIQLAMTKSTSNISSGEEPIDPNTIVVSNARVFGNGTRQVSIYSPKDRRNSSQLDNKSLKNGDVSSHINDMRSGDFPEDFPEDFSFSQDNVSSSDGRRGGKPNFSFKSRSKASTNDSDRVSKSGGVSGHVGKNRGYKPKGGRGGRGGKWKGSGSSKGGSSRNSSRAGRGSKEDRPSLHQLLKSGGRLPNE